MSRARIRKKKGLWPIVDSPPSFSVDKKRVRLCKQYHWRRILGGTYLTQLRNLENALIRVGHLLSKCPICHIQYSSTIAITKLEEYRARNSQELFITKQRDALRAFKRLVIPYNHQRLYPPVAQ